MRLSNCMGSLVILVGLGSGCSLDLPEKHSKGMLNLVIKGLKSGEAATVETFQDRGILGRESRWVHENLMTGEHPFEMGSGNWDVDCYAHLDYTITPGRFSVMVPAEGTVVATCDYVWDANLQVEKNGTVQRGQVAWDFGVVSVGGSAGPVSINLRNLGRAYVNVKQFTSSNPAFTLDVSNFTNALSPLEGRSFKISFKPTVPGPQSADLTITWSDQTFTFRVTGSGA